MGNSIAEKPDEERIAHYRERAAESMDHARKSTADDDKAAWLTIASKWAALADEVEKQAQREVDIAAINAA